MMDRNPTSKPRLKPQVDTRKWENAITKQMQDAKVLKYSHCLNSAAVGDVLRDTRSESASPSKAVRGSSKADIKKWEAVVEKRHAELAYAKAERDFGWGADAVAKHEQAVRQRSRYVHPPALPRATTKEEAMAWSARLPVTNKSPDKVRYEFCMGGTSVGEALVVSPSPGTEPKRASRLTTREETKKFEAAAGGKAMHHKQHRYAFTFESPHVSEMFAGQHLADNRERTPVDENPCRVAAVQVRPFVCIPCKDTVCRLLSVRMVNPVLMSRRCARGLNRVPAKRRYASLMQLFGRWIPWTTAPASKARMRR